MSKQDLWDMVMKKLKIMGEKAPQGAYTIKPYTKIISTIG
jgi:hypothetical protein